MHPEDSLHMRLQCNFNKRLATTCWFTHPSLYDASFCRSIRTILHYLIGCAGLVN